MGALGLCKDDPLIKALREVFAANIIRVPEERYRPLTVLASKGNATSFRGSLPPLIDGQPPPQFDPSIFAASRMANISGRRSRSVSLELGLQILEGFLQGLGIPAGGITTKFSGASKVSYTFNDVQRIWVDINVVGRVLSGRHVDRDNPAASVFFGNDRYGFYVLDSVVTSTDFAIAVDRSSDSSFKLDVPAIQKAVGDLKVGVSVSSSSGFDLNFKGSTQLAYAFSCVRFQVADDGRIESLVPDQELKLLSPAPMPAAAHDVPGEMPAYCPGRVLLSAEPVLLEVN